MSETSRRHWREVLRDAREAAAKDPEVNYNSADTRKALVETFKVACNGKIPYDWQLDVSEALILHLDCLVIAGTGFGKTMPFAMPLLVDQTKRKMVLVLSPLNDLERDQAERFVKMGLTAAAVNAEDYTSTLHKAIEKRQRRVLITSPEMCLKHPQFSKLMYTPAFTQDILAVIVDEAHCITSWGPDFRKTYAEIAKIRSLVSTSVPFLATSATMTPLVQADVQHKLAFSPSKMFYLNLGNDRCNITPIVCMMRGCSRDLDALNFVIDEAFTGNALRRTVIFCNSRDLSLKSSKHLRSRLPDVYKDQVEFFHAFRSTGTKRQIMKDFMAGTIKILCATEAAGMGMDVKDLGRMVQLMTPRTFVQWLQRKGRVGRDDLPAIAILLVEPTVFQLQKRKKNAKKASPADTANLDQDEDAEEEDDENDVTQVDGSQREGAPQDKKQDKLKGKDEIQITTGTVIPPGMTYKKNIDHGMRSWLETPECRRDVADEYFKNPRGHRKALTAPCCDNCVKNKKTRYNAVLTEAEHNILALIERIESRIGPADVEGQGQPDNGTVDEDDEVELETQEDDPMEGTAREGPKLPAFRRGVFLENAREALITWRRWRWRRDYPVAVFGPAALLPDSVIKTITWNRKKYQTVDDFKTHLPQWIFAEKYGPDVLVRLAGKDDEEREAMLKKNKKYQTNQAILKAYHKEVAQMHQEQAEQPVKSISTTTQQHRPPLHSVATPSRSQVTAGPSNTQYLQPAPVASMHYRDYAYPHPSMYQAAAHPPATPEYYSTQPPPSQRPQYNYPQPAHLPQATAVPQNPWQHYYSQSAPLPQAAAVPQNPWQYYYSHPEVPPPQQRQHYYPPIPPQHQPLPVPPSQASQVRFHPYPQPEQRSLHHRAPSHQEYRFLPWQPPA